MLKRALSDLFDQEELAKLSSAFDIIGDIAILKIPTELQAKEQIIAKKILSNLKNVHTVLKQNSPVKGEFRTRELSCIGGLDNYLTQYKENGCVFKVDVRSVYFSPRLATERQRIESVVSEGERIFNMFAGIGTFSIIIAKKKNCLIDSVDRNPDAFALSQESLKLNKKLKGKVFPMLAEAREYAMLHPNYFDRVLMPLPEKSHQFLPYAIFSAKRGESIPVIHYYVHVSEEHFNNEGWLVDHLRDMNLQRRYEVLNWKRVREVGPRYVQAVADIALVN